ncbi:MAG: TonB-dependent receptor, partial [Pseudomonadota bacterium]
FANLMTNEVDDFDRLPDQGAPASPIRLNERDNTDWIQELRLLYDDGDRLEVLLGGLYARRFSDDLTRVEQTFGVPAIELTALARINPDLDLDAIYQDAVDTASGGTATIAGVPAGAPLLVSDPILLGDTAAIGSDFNFEPDFTTLAVFGEASYDLTDALEFTFGFRYEREEAKFTTFQLNALIEPTDIAAVSATGNPELAPAVEGALTTALTPSLGAGDAAAVAGGATPLIVPRYGEFVQTLVLLANGASDEAFLPFTSTNEQTFNVFMPKFVLSYDVTDNVSVALSAQRAYRPGGIGINPVRLSLFDFGPEFSWNYELAFRSVTADGRLVFNGNVFYIDWTDQQIEVQLTETAQDEETQNVGSSELYGIELQASFDATDDLQLFASIGVIETEITAVDDTNLALLNNEFPFAPNYSGSAGFTYRHPSGFNGTFDLTFQGESFVLLPNQQAAGTGLKNDSRLLANARIGYDFDNFSVYAFASNLFDDTYFVNADAAGGNVILGDPRVVGGGVSFEF